jgi:hypothetical protein
MRPSASMGSKQLGRRARELLTLGRFVLGPVLAVGGAARMKPRVHRSRPEPSSLGSTYAVDGGCCSSSASPHCPAHRTPTPQPPTCAHVVYLPGWSLDACQQSMQAPVAQNTQPT